MSSIEENIRDININRLLEGYQYGDLPEDYLLGKYKDNLSLLIDDIFDKNNLYDVFKFDDDGLIDITKLKNCENPMYIHMDGAEPISFFDFKKNGVYREIQIPNLIYYISFIYNSIKAFDDIFGKIYNEENDFTNYSNSYVVFDKEFKIRHEYSMEEITIVKNEFATKNNKSVNQLSNKKLADKYFEFLDSNLYVLKLDIESFYPNIYTHYLERIKKYAPYKDLIENNCYFDFLDKYNMKVNSNQTKGIIAGCFSSNISSELMMLCVDNEIEKIIKNEDISYIRYVDDFTFFSNSKERLEEFIDLTQKILNKYKLRINHSKTEIMESVLYNNSVDFKQIDFDFNSLGNIWETTDEINHLKKIFKNYLETNNLTECKILLTKIRRKISDLFLERSSNIFEASNDSFFEKERFMKIENMDYIINYLLQLIFYSPVIAVNCYKLIAIIIEYYKVEDMDYVKLVNCLCKKTHLINNRYNDTIVQIWHYYILNQYNNVIDKKKMFEELKITNDKQDADINPLVLMTFINVEHGSNRDIINYVKIRYENHVGKVGKKLGAGIMFSKWWLILLLVHINDKYNYHSFYESNAFNKIWKMLSNNNILED